MKRLLFIVLLSFLLALPGLAQDIELTESYTNESGELTFSYPDGWEVDDQDFDVYLTPDTEAYPEFENVSIVFAFLTEQIADALGITSGMSGEDAMGLVVDSMGSPDGLTISEIVLAEYGENQTSTIEIEGGGEFMIASVVESSGGAIMVRLIGSGSDNTVAIDAYYDIIASTVLDMEEPIIGGDDEPAEDVSEVDEEAETSEEADTSEEESAETVELGETYNNFELGMRFNYPDGWVTQELFGDIYVSPDADAEFGIGFLLLTDDMTDEVGITSDMGAEEAMQRLLTSPDMEFDLTADDIVVAQYGDNITATVDTGEDGFVLGTVVETPNGLLLAQSIGSVDEVDAVKEIYFAMIATLVLQETVELSEDFASKSDELSFSYPEGWDVEDDETRFYVTPADENLDAVSIQVSLWTSEVEEAFGIGQFDSAIDVANLYTGLAEDADLEVTDVSKLAIGEYLAASITVIESEDSTFYGIFLETDDGLLMIEIAGPEDQIDSVENVVLSMIASLEYQP